MKRRQHQIQVEVDEVFLDASNLPAFDSSRLEGKRELPLQQRSILRIGILFVCGCAFLLNEIFTLQIIEGAELRVVAEKNTSDHVLVIAERGVIYDRRGELLAWNATDESGTHDFPVRAYANHPGVGHVVGYVSYPRKDRRGFYYRTEYIGRSGSEMVFDEILKGQNGSKLLGVNALSTVVNEYAERAPVGGEAVRLSIDAELSTALYDIIATSSIQAGFRSGAGAIINVETGELIALTSFPSFDPEVMAHGHDQSLIDAYTNDAQLPFLNKVVSGVYTPGSVVKPFVAYAALAEGIISPNKTIVSTGEIVIPNRFNPSNPSRFTDWRAHGRMTMREAIAFSSNVYFYIIGGGYGDQNGLGITKMAEYYRKFGLGSPTGMILAEEPMGVVPDPAWKQTVFADDWRLGDTYFTAIGQFGFLTTPLQMLRAYAALANGGYLVTPHLEAGRISDQVDIQLDPAHLRIVQEGMRMAVNYNGGTARGLDRSDVAIAAKSGTAEVGVGNAYVNSWAAGFWPYEDPQYAFVLMMDRAPRSNALGATNIMGKVVEWMAEHRPEYLGISSSVGELE